MAAAVPLEIRFFLLAICERQAIPLSRTARQAAIPTQAGALHSCHLAIKANQCEPWWRSAHSYSGTVAGTRRLTTKHPPEWVLETWFPGKSQPR